MMIVMKRTQAFMVAHVESKSLRDPLDGKVAKLLQFESSHNLDPPSPFRGSVLGEGFWILDLNIWNLLFPLKGVRGSCTFPSWCTVPFAPSTQ